MKYWVIIHQDGTLQQVMSNDKPAESNGYDVSEAQFVGEVPRFCDPLTETLNETRTGWITNLDALKAQAVAQINKEREARQMEALTSGGAKKFVYSQKADELRAYRQGYGTYPFAEAQAAKTGQTLDQVMDEFEQGATASVQEVARIESIARCAILEIKAATTDTEIQEALAVDWLWTNQPEMP